MEISVVSPTFNEAENVERLMLTISDALRGVTHEIIIVDDDSPDQTWRVAQDLARKYTTVRVLRRQASRSLAGSVIAGFEIAAGDAVACIDADLQHDAMVLLKMLAELRAGVRPAPDQRCSNSS